MTNIMKGRIFTLVVRLRKITSKFNDCRAQKRIIHHQNRGYRKSQKNRKEFEQRADEQAVRKVQHLIDSVGSGGPSGLPQLGALSDVVDRPIEIYDEKGNLQYTIGENKNGRPVKLEHHKPKGDQSMGHFTLPGGEEPLNKANGLNMCLYDVVGAQTGSNPQRLKSATLEIMNDHKTSLAHQINDITRLETNHNLKLCMGGASYNGNFPTDARRHLDDSNGIRGFRKDREAHPRMHASMPDADAYTDCVEKYSRGGWKSGHDSRDEQDFVTHYALSTDKAKRAMAILNEYGEKAVGRSSTQYNRADEQYLRQVIQVTRAELNLARESGGGKWVEGFRTESWPVRDVTLVLQHHVGQELNRDYPVHIQTAYPVQPR